MYPQRPSGPSGEHRAPDNLKPMTNRLPTGLGSRGGKWHDPVFRRAYFRNWRKNHPEYRERERQRRLLKHMEARVKRVVEGGPYERP